MDDRIKAAAAEVLAVDEAKHFDNVKVKVKKFIRLGANRAEHRKNVKALKRAKKERARVRAEHDANNQPGTFKPGPAFE